MSKKAPLLLTLGAATVLPFLGQSFTTHAAGNNLSLSLLDGTSVNAVVGDGDTDWSSVKSAVGENEFVAAIYDGCKEAESPAELANESSKNVTIVTKSKVTSSGTWGTVDSTGNKIDLHPAKWFIYNNKLYIVGNGSVTGMTGVNVMKTQKTSTSGEKLDISIPSIQAKNISKPELFDEQKYTGIEYYTYTMPKEKTMNIVLGNHEETSYSTYITGNASSSTYADQNIPWESYSESITDVYFDESLQLKGSFNFLFNRNSTQAAVGYVGESKYKSLKNIYLYADMSGVTQAAGMFARLPNLENIYVKTGKKVNLKTLNTSSFMFYGDTKLVNSTDSAINALDLSSGYLLDTQYMFAGCSNIISPAVSDYNMSNVKSANGMFYGADRAGLTATGTSEKNDIANWTMNNVTSASFMFAGSIPLNKDGVIDFDSPTKNVGVSVKELKDSSVITGNVNMSKWKMDSLINAYMMFGKQTALTGIFAGTDYMSLEHAAGMFYMDVNLQNGNFKGTSMPKLKDASYMFRGAGSKTTGGTIDFENSYTPNLKYASLMFYGTGYKKIGFDSSSPMKNLKDAVAMFADNTYLGDLGRNSLAHWTMNELEDASHMFRGDSSIVKISTANWDMGKVKDISYMFADCTYLSGGIDTTLWYLSSELKNMDCFAYKTSIPSFSFKNADMYGVESAFMAFAENASVSTVLFPTTSDDFFHSLITANGMFYNDSALKAVDGLIGASKLVDATGMFAGDKELVALNINGFIGKNTTSLAYMFRGVEKLKTLDISKWDTSNVEYMQGFADGAKSLENIKIGNDFKGNNVKSLGMAFRNNYVHKTDSMNKLLSTFTGTTKMKDMHAAFNNAYAITELDISMMDLSAVTDFIKMAAMDGDAERTTNNLVTIKVPSSILTAEGVKLKDDSNDNKSIKMFYVVGNGTSSDESNANDDLVTTLFVNGTIGENLANYPFGGSNRDNDNRSFVLYKGRTINGKDVGTYSLANSEDKAAMKLEAESTLYTEGTSKENAKLSQLAYSWTHDGKDIPSSNANTYTVTKNMGGNYIATVSPAAMKGSKSETSITFLINSAVKSLKATYKGKKVTIGTKYSKEDVIVTAINDKGDEITLTVNDWEVDSQDVIKTGDNNYTVSYGTGNDKMTTKLIVPGIHRIGCIETTYNGPAVTVGEEYNKIYLKTIAYYVDDTDKKNGFEVKPTSYSDTIVKVAGDNTFTSFYKDEEGREFTSKFNVNGFKTISMISASYIGNPVIVGEKYDKNKVIVTLSYADGSGSATTTNFGVNSLTVSSEGTNNYTATYRDPFGKTYTGNFVVTGVKKDENITSKTSISGSDDNRITDSSVLAPDSESSASAIESSTNVTYDSNEDQTAHNAGIVQTGTTDTIEKAAGLLILGITMMLILIYMRRKILNA